MEEFWAVDFIVDDDIMWFVHGSMDILFQYNITENRMIDMYFFHDKCNISYARYRRIVKYNNRIIIFPGFSNDIVIFDIYSKEFDYVKPKAYITGTLVQNVYVDGNIAYLIPQVYHYFMRLNLDSLQLEYVYNWKKDIKLESNDYPNKYIPSSCRIGNEVLFVKNDENICSFDLKTEAIQFNKFSFQGLKLGEIACDKNWIYVYDLNSKSIFKISNEGEKQNESIKNELCYLKTYKEDSLIVDDIDSPESKIYSTSNFKKLKEWTLFDRNQKKDVENIFCYNSWFLSDEYSLLFSGRGSLLVNLKTGETKKILLDDEIKKKYYKNIYEKYGFRENAGYQLHDFLLDI